jgi:hypothetical protein
VAAGPDAGPVATEAQARAALADADGTDGGIRSADLDHLEFRRWPARPPLTVTAASVEQEATPEGRRFVLRVAAVDPTTGDALRGEVPVPLPAPLAAVWSIQLDTARYFLTATERAFAVRVASGFHSPESSSEGEVLFLFRPNGHALESVLEVQSRASTRAPGPDAGTAIETSTVWMLGMSRKATGGIFDIDLWPRGTRYHAERSFRWNGTRYDEVTKPVPPPVPRIVPAPAAPKTSPRRR